jgi:hypothetical protein
MIEIFDDSLGGASPAAAPRPRPAAAAPTVAPPAARPRRRLWLGGLAALAFAGGAAAAVALRGCATDEPAAPPPVGPGVGVPR